MDELEKIIDSQFNKDQNPQYKKTLPPQSSKAQEKSEEEKNGAIEIENSDSDEDFELELEDEYEICHSQIKKAYTIKRKKDIGEEVIKRMAYCKTKDCKAKAKLLQYGKNKKSRTELFYNKSPHLETCKVDDYNVFDDKKLKEYLEEGLKPEKVISKLTNLVARK